jgi:hypothetical protein
MSDLKKEVDRLFRRLPTERGACCRNPVGGGNFLRGLDPIAPQKRFACRALVAREWAKEHSPLDLPPLPLGDEIEEMKHGWDLLHLWAYFARSVSCREYSLSGHPPFDVYAQGVLGSPWCPPRFRENEELNRRFPPRHVTGLSPHLIWEPTEVHAETMDGFWHAEAREARERRRAS